ncbi:MAG: hypothetical protein ACYDA1_05940, partial [Vulcanimicrobiaceae bacterium]
MVSSFLRFASRFGLGVGALSVAALLVACGGGSTSSMLPNSPSGVQSTGPVANSSSEIPLGSLIVDPTDTSAMAATLDAQAFASPVIGRKPLLSRVGAMFAPATSYPDDLHFYGGKVVTAAKSIDLYVNCAAGCWGTPSTFQTNLSKSTFIHLLDQYVHVTT